MKEVVCNGTLIARFGNVLEAPVGSVFFTDDKDPLQSGVFVMKRGTLQPAHIHKIRERIPAHRTYEFIYVISGAILVSLYTLEKEFIKGVLLKQWDWIQFYSGGHGIETLEDARFIEIKNGPYAGVAADKERFDAPNRNVLQV